MIGTTLLSLLTLSLASLSSVLGKDFYLGTRYGKRDEYPQPLPLPPPAKTIPLSQAFARFLDISIQIPERQREILLDRYSRSNPPAPIEVAPRNDRFFMGTRYGKRNGNDDMTDFGRETDDLRSMGLECQHSGNGQRILECNRRRTEFVPLGSTNIRTDDPALLGYNNDQFLT